MASPAPFNDFRTLLTAANLGYPIAWPNTNFGAPEPPAPWLSVQAESRTLDPIEIPARSWSEEGTFYIDVSVPAGTGTDLARTIAKNVANIVRGLGPRDVVYLGGAVSNGGVGEEDGLWWTMTVSIDFRYDDTLA